jgi:serine/threonine-protein kinase
VIGRTLGRYRITSKLGEGGMGSVWRAEDPALGRTVALKLLSPALWASDTARQRFVREARAASKLDHPSIATVYDVGETDGLAWIAYQFIDGETVAACIARGPLPLAEALALAIETAQALEHAHERGVLHRDVTAGNVMVTREGRAVLVDFGLALPERGAHLTTTGTALGTAGYMAPEVMRGQPADERSDLYGLGAVLYRMVTGRLPFEGDVPEAVIYRMLNEPVPPPSELRAELPPALERVVLRLLKREPADRYASATEVVEALREVAPERGPTRVERARRANARRWRNAGAALRRVGRVRIGVAALASLALLAAATWFAARQGWLPGTAHEPTVIAVLPFENASSDPEETAYLGEGLGAEMAARLGQGSRLRILPWQTSRRYEGSPKSLQTIARELHAGALLVGSYRADEERVHVTATVVDGRSGLQRWSRSFEALLTDFLTVQTNIAVEVASNLEGTLAPLERSALAKQPTTNPDAYAYYLNGANYLQNSDIATRSLAGPYFNKAIELDPNLAEAYVGRGAVSVDAYFRGLPGGRELLGSGQSDFERALALRPGMPRAVRGLIGVDYETGQIEDMYRTAVQVAGRGDDDVEGLVTRGWALTLGGLPEEGVPILGRVLELDPGNREAAWFRIVALAWSDQHELALQRGKQFVRQFGEDPEVYTWMAVAANSLEKVREGAAYAERAIQLFGDDDSNLYITLVAANLFAQAGEHQKLNALFSHWIPVLRQRHEAAPENLRVLTVLMMLQWLVGNRTESLRALDAALEVEAVSPWQGSARLALVGMPVVLGDFRRLDRAVELVRKGDLAVLQPFTSKCVFEIYFDPARMRAWPEIASLNSLRSDISKRREALRQKYVPIIGLHDRSSGARR